MFDKQKKQKSIDLGQNYLVNKSLVKKLIEDISIKENEHVIEIGPGKGIITRELVTHSKRVTVVEYDTEHVSSLKQKDFGKKIEIVHADFLTYKLPDQPFLVVANPPFNITSAILKKCITTELIPERIFLVMQKEAVDRFIGASYHTQMSVLINTMYDSDIVHTFERSDFSPVPSVDTCFISFILKNNFPSESRKMFFDLVTYAFSRQKAYAFKNMEQLFTYKQWKTMGKQYKFPVKIAIGDISCDQWMGIYSVFKKLVVEEKQKIIIGASANWLEKDGDQ